MDRNDLPYCLIEHDRTEPAVDDVAFPTFFDTSMPVARRSCTTTERLGLHLSIGGLGEVRRLPTPATNPRPLADHVIEKAARNTTNFDVEAVRATNRFGGRS